MKRDSKAASILRHVVSASLASTAACGSAIDLDDFDELSCADNGYSANVVSDLSTDSAFDYIELRRYEDFGGEEPLEPEITQTFGTACSNASDAEACEAAIATASSTSGFELGQCVQVCSLNYFVVNRGDEVTVIDSRDALLSFLGTIDTPSEAVLAAMNAGYSVRCANIEGGGVQAVGDSYEVVATQITSACDPVEETRFLLAVERDGKVTVLESEVIDSDSGSCIGRRPGGHVVRRARGRNELGAYLASVAHLEAASVHAFAEIEAELVAHRAPRSLVRKAQRARRDEVRHARAMRALARRFGGSPPAPRTQPRPVRSLYELALDNAVEGCVRETFGAVVGHYQATHARHMGLRQTMRRIARDETDHAALSWELHRWAMPKLRPAERKRILDAQDEALAPLADVPRESRLRSLVEIAGMPDPAAHRRLVAAFRHGVATQLRRAR